MKKYILLTHSDSGDRYTYFLKSKSKPSGTKLSKFLMKYGSDKDDEFSYENVQSLIEIIEENFKVI